MVVFLDHNQIEKVGHLSGDSSQTFIDIIHEVNTYRTLHTGTSWLFDSNLCISLGAKGPGNQ